MTNAEYYISFYIPYSLIKDAIGGPDLDIKEPRFDTLGESYAFSKIDSISNDYISHRQYFDVIHANFLREAIKEVNIFFNKNEPVYYRFLLI